MSCIEDVRHLFFTCPFSHEIIKTVEEKVIMALDEYGQSLELDTHHVILGYTNGNKVLRSFVNFCLLVMKWELWKTRNNIKFENRRYTVNEIVRSIIQKIKAAADFIAMNRVAARNEKVLNMLKKLE